MTLGIIDFIELMQGSPELRDLNVFIFKRGDCWRFALMCKKIFAGTKAHQCWHKTENFGHVLGEYENKYYDITGEVNISDWEIDTPDMSDAQLKNYVPLRMTAVHKFITS